MGTMYLETHDRPMKPPLYVIFTMDCLPAGNRVEPAGPPTWEQSARAIEGFCTRLQLAGYAVTLFLTPECAEHHEPFTQELRARGVELGLYVHPQSLDPRFKQYLGQYGREQQRAVAGLALQQLQATLGMRPQSVRSAMFSASDETFAVLYELGFRQGSVSSPGRRVSKHAAVWTGAETQPHYVDPHSRLRAGDMPFLEIPVTTDAQQERGGLAPDLAIENGTVEEWHRPLIEAQLQRMEDNAMWFRTLCFYTRNRFDYYSDREQPAATLEALLGYLAELRVRYDIVPATVAGAHDYFRLHAVAHREDRPEQALQDKYPGAMP
jgi:hypothetical protein